MFYSPSNENIFNYGGLPPDFSGLKDSKVVILPIPLEKTTSYVRGTEYGPNAVIEASKNMELYDQELDCEPYKVGIHTDLSLTNSNFALIDIDQSLDLIEKAVNGHLSNGKFVVSIGGEHSITPGIVKAYNKTFKKDFTVIQFDAHADLRDEFRGEKLSHACAMRRVFEKNKIVEIGIRSLSVEEARLIKSKNLKVFYAGPKIDEKYAKAVLKEIKTKDIYITFDVDFLDPSVMPATGTPEPGGYGWYDAIFMIKEFIQNKNLIGIDFNELSPLKSGIKHPDFMIAKLIYKTLSYKYYLPKKF